MRKFLIILVLLLTYSTGSIYSVTDEEPLFDFPVDADLYLIRPGDKLVITFINSKVSSLKLTVNPEGYIIDETIGSFDTRQQTLSKIKSDLFHKLKSLYNVSDISISIAQPRKVTIAIHGAVRNPGIYEAMTSDRVSTIIKKAGGITSNGTKRAIRFEGGPQAIIVDLDRAEYIGDFNANPNLYAGTSIFVPSKSKKTVHVSGEVNKPREIELNSTDKLVDLIALVGGLRSYADSADIHIIRGNKRFPTDNIQADDILYIPAKKVSQDSSNITILGAIKYPGKYMIGRDVTFSEIIDAAGGYLPDANKQLTTIFRKPQIDLDGRVTELRYPITQPVGSTINTFDISLQADDSIVVPVNVGFVKVSGAVLNPGYYPYQTGKDVKFYIINSGGFLPTANTREMLVFNSVSKLTSQVSSGVMVSDGSEIIVSIKEELK